MSRLWSMTDWSGSMNAVESQSRHTLTTYDSRIQWSLFIFSWTQFSKTFANINTRNVAKTLTIALPATRWPRDFDVGGDQHQTISGDLKQRILLLSMKSRLRHFSIHCMYHKDISEGHCFQARQRLGNLLSFLSIRRQHCTGFYLSRSLYEGEGTYSRPDYMSAHSAYIHRLLVTINEGIDSPSEIIMNLY